MANLLLSAQAERSVRPSLPPVAATALVASFGDPAAAEYAEHLMSRPLVVDLTRPTAVEDLRGTLGIAKVSTCVLFLKPSLAEKELAALETLAPLLSEAASITVVSSFRIHFGDKRAATAEANVLGMLNEAAARLVIIRAGQIISKRSRVGQRMRRFGWAFPLVPRRLRSCFLDSSQLFAAIQQCQAKPSRRPITLLGTNRSWRDVLREQRGRGLGSACLTCLAFLLAILLVGQLAALVLAFLIRRRPSLRCWNFDTLRPRSFAELLALCNRHNLPHVKVVGYNNGVVHFGHRFPGRTIVSTVCCKRIVVRGADVIRADCGATIRDATQFLAASGQELPVLPNYSYVCLGTAFFVPIHGSAADYSTVAETIVKALLYDPARDRFMLVTRDDPDFREHAYNHESGVVVLRLWLHVKPKARYLVRQKECLNPSGEELLAALRNPKASNVEIRKASAASAGVRISTYFAAGVPTSSAEAALEFPRDSLGRLWDRLEENALTSFLMHAATRYFAWHVELFFTADEFLLFWQTHQDVPLRKIQLRYIHRDGLPHSPFQEHDCVSVDLFMFRWKRHKFEAYLKQTFAIIRTNPGKHSK